MKFQIQDCCEEMNNIKMQDEGVLEGFGSETASAEVVMSVFVSCWTAISIQLLFNQGGSSATVITHLVRKKVIDSMLVVMDMQ